MKRALITSGMGLLVACALASAAPAATINEVLNQSWDPLTNNPLDNGFGGSGWFLTWDNLGPGSQFQSPGQPQSGLPIVGPVNPPLLSFTFQETGIGGGGGGGTGLVQSTYILGSKCPDENPWSMTFSMLFFHPDFGGTSVDIQLFGSISGVLTSSLTAEEIKAGKMLSWDIAALGGEKVFIVVTPNGGQTYPAGFFMDDANFNCNSEIPEPATLGLVLLGAAAVARRRKK